MLLELISGKRPVDVENAMEDSLVDWVGIIFIFKSITYPKHVFLSINFYELLVIWAGSTTTDSWTRGGW